MKIDQRLAQDIVKRTMKIINYSVNVMNENGIIIASGNPSRIGEHHIGAVLALRNSSVIEIDRELAQKWHNEVRSGINLPITYQSQNIGVIGISGELEEVRYYAQLVKMTAELIVEQAYLLEREQWNRRYREDFILQLLKNNLSESELVEQAQFFAFPLNVTRTVIIIQLTQPSVENVQQLVGYFESNLVNVEIAINAEKQIILLWENEIPTPIHHIMSPLFKKNEYRIAVGLKNCFAKALHLSYQTALSSLRYGQKAFPRKTCYFFEEYKLPALLNNMSHSWYVDELLLPVEKLIENDTKKVLFKTLQQYFLANCDLDRTAQNLFIHINTLRYRLNKIEQITSLSFNKIDEKFILYLSTILKR
ncbi:Sugar diacid regulator [Phocoenobacter uteri]|uniref:Sugar diacid regulator n=1 Tax=Phocoenobacter uteri TaxID=146806 RepID=A0A379CAW5_9PAST|nr:sugar diacid recognition domain-containing protein [Phocoenobacter uteri]MDG6881393.1 hypothetical protein [Phocoenobacter uteri]SUB59421.1 Sugar diacid regulator [Phocoenobacter uteri]